MSQRRSRNADRSDRSDRSDHHSRHRRPQEEVIKARTARGYAEQWWAQRWIGTLESFGWSNRLARGKSYARSGQVIDYHITPGEIVARVQGSRPKPYVVKIAMHTLTGAEWERAIARMASSASYAVRLLNGEMPQDIEDVFTDLGSSLLPTQEWDLKTSCSCPDYANPCKHIAAVHYVLGEAFDQDPFLIFQLRGRSRQDLLAALRAARGGREGREGREPRDRDHDNHGEPPGPLYEPLPQHPSLFWRAERLPEGFDVGLEAPRVPESILARLGSPGPWIGAADFAAALSQAFSAISHTALKTTETSDQKPRKPRKAEDAAPPAPVVEEKPETPRLSWRDTDGLVREDGAPKSAAVHASDAAPLPEPATVPTRPAPAPAAPSVAAERPRLLNHTPASTPSPTLAAAPGAMPPQVARPARSAPTPQTVDSASSLASPPRPAPVPQVCIEPTPTPAPAPIEIPVAEAVPIVAPAAKPARRSRAAAAKTSPPPAEPVPVDAVVAEPVPARRPTASQPTSPALLTIASSRRPEGLSDREMKALELAREALITTERYRNETGISSYEAREELFSLQIRGFLQREGQGRWTSWSLTPKGLDTLGAK